MSYKPNKILAITVISQKANDFWPYDEGDKFWVGGITPKPFQWEYTMTVSAQSHSSPFTPTAGTYNGYDIMVNDWVADENGRVLKIVSILNKSATEITVIAEDFERYNTFQDPNGLGDGGLSTNKGFVFEVDENGMPIVNDIPATFTKGNMFASLYGRFQQWNANFNYLLKKANHDFLPNDVVAIDPNTGEYVKYTAENKYFPVLGSVTKSLPHRFYINPLNRIREDVTPALPSTKGSYVYVDPTTGGLTDTVTTKRAYLQLSESEPSFVVGSASAPTLTSGHRFAINGVELTVGGTAIQDVISLINGSTESHNVVASEVAGETLAQTSASSLAYGSIIGAVPFAATINGVEVTFTSDNGGQAMWGIPGWATIDDMISDINAANVPNIIASKSSDGTLLFLTNTVGGSIQIVNTQNDASGGYPFAGSGSCSGLPLTTAASTDSKIKLERADGDQILVKDITGSTTANLGIYSVHNGKLPIGMVVENWNTKGNVYTVNTITERDNIAPIYPSDSALVLDTGNGEWGYYMFMVDQWVLMTDQDSSVTDANTISVTITPANAGETLIGTVSDGSRVNDVTVIVKTPFDGTPIIGVGDSLDNARLMNDDLVDLAEVNTYTASPSHIYSTGADVDLNFYLTLDGATVGELEVIISYS